MGYEKFLFYIFENKTYLLTKNILLKFLYELQVHESQLTNTLLQFNHLD